MLTVSSSAPRARFIRRLTGATLAAASVAVLVSACSDATTPAAARFLAGTDSNHEIGVVVNSTGKALTLFQLGDPTKTEQIAFGSSSDITPVGLSVRGRYAAVPLGNTASVAYVSLAAAAVQRYFLFAGGNATGSAFVDDSTVIVANTNDNLVGRFSAHQTSDSIQSTVTVSAGPTAIAVTGGHAFIVSTNLDENYAPAGNGLVTEVDPATMQVLDTVSSGGTNSSDIAVGPDGLLYVLNTGDYVGPSSLTIIDPTTMQVVTTVDNMGYGAGAISIDANGLAYISAFFGGTVVWNTATRQFVRDADHPVCAPVTGGACRGAFAATTSADGKLYQLFFGSSAQSLAPYVFVYDAGTYALRDSVSVGVGPVAIAIRAF